MTLIEWIGIGAVTMVSLFISARIMKRGLKTLEDERQKCLERIRNGERQLMEDKKHISASEQLALIHVGLEDLLRLECSADIHKVKKSGNIIELETPAGIWRAHLIMQTKNLRSSHRQLHGKSRWLLEGPGIREEHMDPAGLMRSLASKIRREQAEFQAEPEYLARRLGGIHAVQHGVRGSGRSIPESIGTATRADS